MLVFDVELLHGTYRADPDGSAPTGRQTRGEWPPSPARLFAALTAADGTRDQCRGTTGDELRLLAAAGPPVIQADPVSHHQVLQERYVAGQKRETSGKKEPGKTRKKAQHQEYVARKGVLVRPGVRVAPRSPSVRFSYNLDVGAEHLTALEYRAARVGYLGCADSPVRVSVAVVPDLDVGHIGVHSWVPDPDGEEIVNVHAEGEVERWEAAFDAWSEHGATRSQTRRYQPRASYRHPYDPIPNPDQGSVRAWVRFRRPVAGRRAAVVAQGLKRAVLAQYGGDPPAWLHGHVEGDGEYQLARFLVLPNVGHSHSDGKIHGAAVWVPGGVDETDARNLVNSVYSIEYLSLADGKTITVDGSRRGWATNPRRWRGPAYRWVTALPAVSDHHQRIDSVAVARWCEQAGLPQPIQYRISRKPLLPGGVDLHPTETRRPGHSQTRPYAHVGLIFEEPVVGPVVIGAARSYGLGLCAPCDPEEESK